MIEDTNVDNANNWTTFQSRFGLSGYGGFFTAVHPGNRANPGVVVGNNDKAIVAGLSAGKV